MRSSLSLVLSLSALLALEGCGGRSSPPAAFSYGTQTPLDKAYRRIVVQPGDSLSFIARKYGMSEEAITSLNNLPEGGVLRVGQEIYLPKGSRVQQQRKKIVQLKAKPKQVMIEETSLEPLEPLEPFEPSTPRGAEKVDGSDVDSKDVWEDVKVDASNPGKLPEASQEKKSLSDAKNALDKGVHAAKAKTKEPDSAKGNVKGDDFFDAYREESLEAELESLKKKEPQKESLVKSEKGHLQKPAKEMKEKTLQAPKNEAPFDASVDEETSVVEPEVEEHAQQDVSSAPKVSSSEDIAAPKSAEALSTQKEQTDKKEAISSPAKAESAQNAPDDSDLNTSSVVDPTQFAWPLPFNGDVTLSFNQMVNGAKNDGINITVPRGTPITAIADGVIAHASPVKGFGNLILIKHNEVWMSAYGHLDKVQVKQGSKIKKGAKIGTVGQTGYVKTPQLHFELRQSSKPVDPMKVIKP